MARPSWLFALVLAGTAIGGCLHGSSSGAGKGPFDGAAALGFVKAFALTDDGKPRYRIPGTTGQAEGASYLWNATDVAGWTRERQDFSGSDYLALDRSAVSGYIQPGTQYCSQNDADAVADLPFSNLLAWRAARQADAPTILIGAHWDSQMHSDNDPVPANRHLPDPGANDGASGVGVLLQLMHELSKADLPVSIGVFFIDGEDGFYDCYPLAGSLYFVAHPTRHVDAFVLLDMVGDPKAVYPREAYSRQGAEDLQNLLWRQAKAGAGATHFNDGAVSIQDDHIAFLQGGIPAVDIIDAGRATTFPPQWDTTGDTVDKLDGAMLGIVGQVLLDTLHDAALAPTLRSSTTA